VPLCQRPCCLRTGCAYRKTILSNNDKAVKGDAADGPQIRRLEELVGTPLLQRRREGVRLTAASTFLLEESRAVLSLLEQGVSRTRQAAGLGQPRLRFAVSPYLPEALAVEAASRLRATAAAPGACRAPPADRGGRRGLAR